MKISVFKLLTAVLVSISVALSAMEVPPAFAISMVDENGKRNVGRKTPPTYTKKVLRTFTWGSGKGQLGSNWKDYRDTSGNYAGPTDALSEISGPRKLLIDKTGNILIWDAYNSRIVKVDSKSGSATIADIPFMTDHMAIDDRNTIYGLQQGIVPARIYAYNEQYEKIRDFPIDSVNHRISYVTNIFIENDGNIQILTSLKTFKVHLNKEMLEVKILGKSQHVYPVTERDSIITPTPSGFLGSDSIGREYVLTDSYIKKTNEIIHKVLIYGKEGTFLGDIQLIDDDDVHFDQLTSSPFVDVDSEGNVYQMNITYGEVLLVKWELNTPGSKTKASVRGASMDSSWIFPDSDKRKLTREELSPLTYRPKSHLAPYARNEIFARRGYIFKKEIYREYFLKKPWYKPVVENVSDIQLSPVEMYNVNYILFNDLDERTRHRMKNEELYNIQRKAYLENFHEGGKRMPVKVSWADKAFYYDLDGDGVEEEILYEVHENENQSGDYTLKVNNETVNGYGERMREDYGIVDIDTSDHLKQIIVASDGLSEDYESRFYHYKKGKLAQIGRTDGHYMSPMGVTEFYGNGFFNVTDYPDGFRTYRLMPEGKIVLHEKPRFTGLTYRLFTKNDLKLHKAPDESSERLTVKAGQIIFLDATEGLDWRQVKTRSGTQGWIRDTSRGVQWWDITFDPKRKLGIRDIFDTFLVIAD